MSVSLESCAQACLESWNIRARGFWENTSWRLSQWWGWLVWVLRSGAIVTDIGWECRGGYQWSVINKVLGHGLPLCLKDCFCYCFLYLFHLFRSGTYMCACVCVCVLVHIKMKEVSLLELVLSFHYVNFGDQIHAVRFGQLPLPSESFGWPCSFFFKNKTLYFILQ